jgi:hypothetical protein
MEKVAVSCKFYNELPGSITCGEVLDELRKCKLLRKDSAP